MEYLAPGLATVGSDAMKGEGEEADEDDGDTDATALLDGTDIVAEEPTGGEVGTGGGSGSSNEMSEEAEEEATGP